MKNLLQHYNECCKGNLQDIEKNFEENMCYNRLYCPDCGNEYVEVYELVGIYAKGGFKVSEVAA